MNIDFVELGTYCQTEYRKTLDSLKDKYRKTRYLLLLRMIIVSLYQPLLIFFRMRRSVY